MASKSVSFSISDEISDRLDTAAYQTGLKKSTIVEQGLEIRIKELEKIYLNGAEE